MISKAIDTTTWDIIADDASRMDINGPKAPLAAKSVRFNEAANEFYPNLTQAIEDFQRLWFSKTEYQHFRRAHVALAQQVIAEDNNVENSRTAVLRKLHAACCAVKTEVTSRASLMLLLNDGPVTAMRTLVWVWNVFPSHPSALHGRNADNACTSAWPRLINHVSAPSPGVGRSSAEHVQ